MNSFIKQKKTWCQHLVLRVLFTFLVQALCLCYSVQAQFNDIFKPEEQSPGACASPTFPNKESIAKQLLENGKEYAAEFNWNMLWGYFSHIISPDSIEPINEENKESIFDILIQTLCENDNNTIERLDETSAIFYIFSAIQAWRGANILNDDPIVKEQIRITYKLLPSEIVSHAYPFFKTIKLNTARCFTNQVNELNKQAILNVLFHAKENWKKLAKSLGLTEHYIEYIQQQNPQDVNCIAAILDYTLDRSEFTLESYSNALSSIGQPDLISPLQQAFNSIAGDCFYLLKPSEQPA